jgi:hypothetical protein
MNYSDLNWLQLLLQTTFMKHVLAVPVTATSVAERSQLAITHCTCVSWKLFLGLGAGYLSWQSFFRDFPQILQEDAGTVPLLGYCRFLVYIFPVYRTLVGVPQVVIQTPYDSVVP